MQSFWTSREEKSHQTQTGLSSAGSPVSSDANPLKNASGGVKDHAGLPGVGKQKKLLSKGRGRAFSCLAVPFLLPELLGTGVHS